MGDYMGIFDFIKKKDDAPVERPKADPSVELKLDLPGGQAVNEGSVIDEPDPEIEDLKLDEVLARVNKYYNANSPGRYSRRYSCAEAYEMLIEEMSGFLGNSWTFVKSSNAFKKKDGDYVSYIYIWRSHHNSSYDYIIFDCNVTVDYKKERIMLYQFLETYHIETDTMFNMSLKSFENRLKTDVIPVINALNTDIEAVLKDLTTKSNFWKYHVNPQFLINWLGRDALIGLAKEIIDSMSNDTKDSIKAYLSGDTTKLGSGSVYITFCENGLFDDLR